jgi:GTP-binding protein
MVPAISEDIKGEYKILLNELKQYNKELTDKKRLLAITKCDLVSPEELKAIKKSLPKVPSIFISSASNFHIDELKDKLWNMINED